MQTTVWTIPIDAVTSLLWVFYCVVICICFKYIVLKTSIESLDMLNYTVIPRLWVLIKKLSHINLSHSLISNRLEVGTNRRACSHPAHVRHPFRLHDTTKRVPLLLLLVSPQGKLPHDYVSSAWLLAVVMPLVFTPLHSLEKQNSGIHTAHLAKGLLWNVVINFEIECANLFSFFFLWAATSKWRPCLTNRLCSVLQSYCTQTYDSYVTAG